MKSRESKLVPAMVNISATSYKTNKFQPITIGKVAACIGVRLKYDVVVLDNDRCCDDAEECENLLNSYAIWNRFLFTINKYVHEMGSS